MSVEGEPTSKPVKFRASMATDEQDNPILVFETPSADGQGTTAFIIKGENLFTFYAMLKRGMEGKDRPNYVK